MVLQVEVVLRVEVELRVEVVLRVEVEQVACAAPFPLGSSTGSERRWGRRRASPPAGLRREVPLPTQSDCLSCVGGNCRSIYWTLGAHLIKGCSLV